MRPVGAPGLQKAASPDVGAPGLQKAACAWASPDVGPVPPPGAFLNLSHNI
jgi:hypothetical protein